MPSQFDLIDQQQLAKMQELQQLLENWLNGLITDQELVNRFVSIMTKVG